MLPEIDELATVVVCEDDEPTRELLCDHLTADRYRVLPAPSASDALRLCGYRQPDLMLLDLGLPDAGGIDVLRVIRRADGRSGRFDPELPVIVLSGRASEADRLRGFGAGADDYLVKPFHYPELVARVRRCAATPVGPASGADQGRRARCRPGHAARAGRLHARSSSPTRSSRCCARWPGSRDRVFTKDELLRDVWGFKAMGRTRTLDSHASRLRRKLDPEGSRYVFNCWGVGYRLVEG